MADTVADDPKLAPLWDTPQNLTPAAKTLASSNRAAAWRCVSGHAFARSPRAMHKDLSCPTCSGTNGDEVVGERTVSASSRSQRGASQANPSRSHANDSALGQLIDIDHARRIIVHDAWFGMASNYTTRVFSFTLVRNDRGGLDGDFSAAFDGRQVYTAKVQLAAKAAKTLLQRVSDASVVRGVYAPRIEWTDDMPDIELVIDTGSRCVYLFTRSQGEHHAPWGACINGELFTLPGDEVGRALAAIRKFVPADVRKMAESGPGT